MDRQRIISMAMEVALGARIEETRQMEESLRDGFEALADKVKECSMLKTKKQDMLAEEEAKEKIADDFMVFAEAIDNEDLETLKSFDEKAMMDTILTMMISDGGDIGGLAGFYGDDLNIIGLGLEEKAIMETIRDNNGGFAGEYGDDVPEIKSGLENTRNKDERAGKATIVGKNCDSE